MSTTIELTGKGSEFVRDCLHRGRFSSAEEVVEVALLLLEAQERELAGFQLGLVEAEREAERDGAVKLDDVVTSLRRGQS